MKIILLLQYSAQDPLAGYLKALSMQHGMENKKYSCFVFKSQQRAKPTHLRLPSNTSCFTSVKSIVLPYLGKKGNYLALD